METNPFLLVILIPNPSPKPDLSQLGLKVAINFTSIFLSFFLINQKAHRRSGLRKNWWKLENGEQPISRLFACFKFDQSMHVHMGAENMRGRTGSHRMSGLRQKWWK